MFKIYSEIIIIIYNRKLITMNNIYTHTKING